MSHHALTAPQAKAPLNAFLQMVCPEVGIIAYDNYLSDMGWAFFNGQLVRTNIPNSSDFPSNIQSSTLTVSDLVGFAHARAYFTRGKSHTFSGRKLDANESPFQTSLLSRLPRHRRSWPSRSALKSLDQTTFCLRNLIPRQARPVTLFLPVEL